MSRVTRESGTKEEEERTQNQTVEKKERKLQTGEIN